jgi:hypothetical protein
MKKLYRFNVHQYASELNCYEVLINNQWIKIDIPQTIVKQFTKDYKSNVKIVRAYYKSLHDGKQSLKKVGFIQFQNSNERMSQYAKKVTGLYSDYSTIKEVIKRYKDTNEGYKQLFIGFDDEKNSFYETVYNEVSYTITTKVR